MKTTKRDSSSVRRAFRLPVVLVLALACGAAWPRAQQKPAAPWATRDLRIGIVGTDTSHVPQFTATFAARTEWRMRVVAAFKGGSPDLPTSADRLEGFAATIRDKNGVEIVDSIAALLPKVDVVLLESVDGRTHLAQVTPILKAGKRVFIDKPLAASLEDARRIVQVARETGTPFFTASSARFHPDIERLRANAGVGKVTKVQVAYTLNPLAFHPDLFYYGVHGVEALYAVMGQGCARLTRTVEGVTDVTTCTWKDGRVGVYYGLLKGNSEKLPLVRIWGDKGTVDSAGDAGYDPLVLKIAEFFQTGRAPVAPAESLEVIEFMAAAQLSKDRGSIQVSLDDVRK